MGVGQQALKGSKKIKSVEERHEERYAGLCKRLLLCVTIYFVKMLANLFPLLTGGIDVETAGYTIWLEIWAVELGVIVAGFMLLVLIRLINYR